MTLHTCSLYTNPATILMIYYIYSTNITLMELEAMIAACLHLD